MKLLNILVGENPVFMQFLNLLSTTKNRGQTLHDNIRNVINVTRFTTCSFLHCEDRADSGMKHVGMYCVPIGPHEASYRKTNYAPTTSVHNCFYESSRHKYAVNSICLTSTSQLATYVLYILTSYYHSCLLSASLNSEGLAL